MKIRFPFIYELSVKLPRKKTANTRFALGWEWFDIKELTSQQAPVAIRAQTVNLVPPYITDLDTLYRMYNNSLISEPTVQSTYKLEQNLINSTSVRENFSKENFQNFLNEWAKNCTDHTKSGSRTQVFPLNNKGYATFNGAIAASENQYRRIESSRKQAALIEIATFLKNSAFVDGYFYRASEGPAYLIKSDRTDIYFQDTRIKFLQNLILIQELSDMGAMYRSETFPVYDRKKAVEEFEQKVTAEEKSYRKKNEPNTPNPGIYGKAEIYAKPALSYGEKVILTAKELIKQMNTHVGSMHKNLVYQYVEVRDHTIRIKPSFSKQYFVDLLEQATDLSVEWKNYCLVNQINFDLNLEKELEILAQPEPEIVIDLSNPDALEVSLDDLAELNI